MALTTGVCVPERAPSVVGVLLAAGAGRRAGGPKALRRDTHGRPWVVTAGRTLRVGGCEEVVVVVGSRSEAVASVLVGEPVDVVAAPDWDGGLSASLRRGLERARDVDPTAVLVHLVDLPDVGPAVVERVLAAGPVDRQVLRRAAYDARPGHPVLIGADHLPDLVASLTGDRGAAAYVSDHHVRLVPCGDLAGGRDLDGPDGVGPGGVGPDGVGPDGVGPGGVEVWAGA